VDYNTHLWRTAHRESWDGILAQSGKFTGLSVGIFVVVMGIAWATVGEGSTTTGLLCALAGLAALLICYTARFLAHLLYFTPRNLLAEKQKQLLEERIRFGNAIATLENRFEMESRNRVTTTLEKFIPLVKGRQFSNPVAALYEAGVAELEPWELDDFCLRVVQQQLPHPFAGIPNAADYWIWLLQSATERGVRLSTQKDLSDFHVTVQLENQPPAESIARAEEITAHESAQA